MQHMPSNPYLFGLQVVLWSYAILSASDSLVRLIALVVVLGLLVAFEIPTKFFRFLVLVYMELYSCWRESR